MESTFKSLIKSRSKSSDEVVPPSPLKGWSTYLAIGAVASETFMGGIQKLPVQEREL